LNQSSGGQFFQGLSFQGNSRKNDKRSISFYGKKRHRFSEDSHLEGKEEPGKVRSEKRLGRGRPLAEANVMMEKKNESRLSV